MSLGRAKENRSHSDLCYEETFPLGDTLTKKSGQMITVHTLLIPFHPLHPSLPPVKHCSHKKQQVFYFSIWNTISERQIHILHEGIIYLLIILPGKTGLIHTHKQLRGMNHLG